MPELLPVQSILFQNLLRDFQVVAPPRVPVWWLSDIIQPVSIVNSQVTLTATVDERAMLFASNGVQIAPPIATVLAGTGQLPAGLYLFRVYVNWSDNAVSNHVLIQHRDAADAANIWEHSLEANSGDPAAQFTMEWTETLVANERIRLLVALAGTATMRYNGIIWRSLIS